MNMEKINGISLKLVFWMLGFLGMLIMGIGGFTVTHLVTKADVDAARLNMIETTANGNLIRILNLEKNIDARMEDMGKQLDHIVDRLDKR